MSINGQAYVIKLWMRAGDKLTKKRVEATLHLLDITVGAPDVTVGILDVRRGNLITPTRLIPGIDALLQAEASGFITMWNAL